MRTMLAMLCLMVVAFPPSLLAQECDPSDESQAGMNICADAGYRDADKKLNAAYRRIVESLSGDAEGKKLLVAAQRAWIAFRDAECAFSTADSTGGSIHPMLVSECLTELTELRTKQLDSNLDCQEGDLSCPVPVQ